MLNNLKKGELAQLKCQLKSIEKGYSCSVPTNLHGRYDLLIDTNKAILRTQVKYCDSKVYKRKNILLLTFSGLRHTVYNKNEIDLILCYLPLIDKILAFWPNKFHNKSNILIHLTNPNSKNFWGKFEW